MIVSSEDLVEAWKDIVGGSHGGGSLQVRGWQWGGNETPKNLSVASMLSLFAYDLYVWFWGLGALQGPVLVFVALPDCDAMATAMMIMQLLKAEMVRYEAVPIAGYTHLIERFTDMVSTTKPRSILLINCGAKVRYTNLSSPLKKKKRNPHRLPHFNHHIINRTYSLPTFSVPLSLGRYGETPPIIHHHRLSNIHPRFTSTLSPQQHRKPTHPTPR